MTSYTVILDGCDGYEEWPGYEVRKAHLGDFERMIADIKEGLEELGGGHADVFEDDSGNFAFDLEV